MTLDELLKEVERQKPDLQLDEVGFARFFDYLRAVLSPLAPDIGAYLSADAAGALALLPGALRRNPDAALGAFYRQAISRLVVELAPICGPSLPGGPAALYAAALDILAGDEERILQPLKRPRGGGGRKYRVDRAAAARRLFDLVHYEAARRELTLPEMLNTLPGSGLSAEHWDRVSAEVRAELRAAGTDPDQATLGVRDRGRAAIDVVHHDTRHLTALLQLLAN